jgi:hypothetical protein
LPTHTSALLLLLPSALWLSWSTAHVVGTRDYAKHWSEILKERKELKEMEKALTKAEKQVLSSKHKLDKAEKTAIKRDTKAAKLVTKTHVSAETAAVAAEHGYSGSTTPQPPTGAAAAAAAGASAAAAAAGGGSAPQSPTLSTGAFESDAGIMPADAAAAAGTGPALVHRASLRGKGTKVDLAESGVLAAEHQRSLIEKQVEEKLLETQREIHSHLREGYYTLWLCRWRPCSAR